MSNPTSRFTPDIPFVATVAGHHVYSNGTTFSIDEKLDNATQEAIIDYMLSEGLIDESKDWMFLT